MFRRGNPFVCAREETSSTHRVSHLRAGLSLSWPSHHIQPNLLKSCQLAQWYVSHDDNERDCQEGKENSSPILTRENSPILHINGSR